MLFGINGALPSTVKYRPDTRSYEFSYPCQSTYDCYDYNFSIEPGIYKFELYGASGGSDESAISAHRITDNICISDEIISSVKGNVKCVPKPSRGGAGGYISGIIVLKKSTRAYATIGGKGEYGWKIRSAEKPQDYAIQNMERGGYGGGGSASNFHPEEENTNSGAGGGQTALKFDTNDLWHRVLVSGGGGGCDNTGGEYYGEDDGSGGSGGGFTAQGFWIHGVYKADRRANSTFGFTFGSGEAAREIGSKNSKYGYTNVGGSSDKAGSGGGWFGGFASHNADGGAGGGSSWALSEDAIIPSGKIEARDEFYHLIDRKEYAFTKKSGYLFSSIDSYPGVWNGNGKMIVTIISNFNEFCKTDHFLFVLEMKYLFGPMIFMSHS